MLAAVGQYSAGVRGDAGPGRRHAGGVPADSSGQPPYLHTQNSASHPLAWMDHDQARIIHILALKVQNLFNNDLISHFFILR